MSRDEAAGSPEGPGGAATPYWSEFLSSLNENNAFVRPGALRRYQAGLLNHGEVRIISPYNGTPVISRSNAVGPPGQIAYYFPGPPCFWLLTPRSKFIGGHPLADAIFESGALRCNVDGSKGADHALSSDVFQKLRATSKDPDSSEARPATLIIGHWNFAHHLWNELPALETWLRTASDDDIRRLSIISVAEPLGRLEEIFPRLSLARLSRDRGRDFDNKIAVRVGSCLVTRQIREVLRGHAASHGNTPRVRELVRQLSDRWPRVWISIRQGSRTPDNQSEFLLTAIREILRAYKEAMFVLDGFSFPMGFLDDPRTRKDRDVFGARATAASECIESLRNMAAGEKPELRSRLLNLSHLNLLESIHVAGHSDYYLCHAGTLQHKIAWFHDIPGFVHTTPRDYQYSLWCTKQVEAGIVPDFLPRKFSARTSSPVFRQDIPRNYNYRILDESGAVKAVLSAMKSRLRSR